MQHLIYLMTILSSLSTYKEKKINEPSATLSITWIKARQRYANWTRRHELNANLSEKERAQKDALLIQNNRVSHVSKMLRVFDWWPFKSWIWAVSFPNKCPNMFRKCWQYSIVGYPSDILLVLQEISPSMLVTLRLVTIQIFAGPGQRYRVTTLVKCQKDLSTCKYNLCLSCSLNKEPSQFEKSQAQSWNTVSVFSATNSFIESICLRLLCENKSER